MHKSFDFDKPAVITFDLGGEQFIARAAPGWMFIESMQAAEETGPEAELKQIALTVGVLKYAMTHAEYERFQAFCRDEAGVSLQMLMELVQYLCEGSVQGRPTQPPSDSSRGREPTGDISEVGSFSPVSNGAPSQPTSSVTSPTP